VARRPHGRRGNAQRSRVTRVQTDCYVPADPLSDRRGQGASNALDHLLDIATAHDSTVHILNVANTTKDTVVRMQGDVVDVLERDGERIVRDAADQAQERGVAVVTEVRQGEPYSTIVDYANSRDVDLIVMPTHGRRGLERFLLGSTTERVVRRADVPVLTIRPTDDSVTYPYRNVLVPTDGSDCARTRSRSEPISRTRTVQRCTSCRRSRPRVSASTFGAISRRR